LDDVVVLDAIRIATMFCDLVLHTVRSALYLVNKSPLSPVSFSHMLPSTPMLASGVGGVLHRHNRPDRPGLGRQDAGSRRRYHQDEEGMNRSCVLCSSHVQLKIPCFGDPCRCPWYSPEAGLRGSLSYPSLDPSQTGPSRICRHAPKPYLSNCPRLQVLL
jgi:hypothetical protein